MGTIFLVLIGRAKRAPHWGVQSRFRVIYICCRYVVCRMFVVCQINFVGGIKADRTSETEEQRKESLRIRREKDRARRRTKGKKRSPDTDDYEKQRLATLKRLKRGEVDLRLEKVVASKQLRLAVETEEKKNKTGSFSEKLAAMLIIQIWCSNNI